MYITCLFSKEFRKKLLARRRRTHIRELTLKHFNRRLFSEREREKISSL